MNIYCIAEFKAKEGKQEELHSALKLLEPLGNEEEGCIFYQVTKQVENKYASGTSEFDFTFIEKFKDVEAFEFHCNQSYVSDFFNGIGTELIESYNVRTFTNE